MSKCFGSIWQKNEEKIEHQISSVSVKAAGGNITFMSLVLTEKELLWNFKFYAKYMDARVWQYFFRGQSLNLNEV